MPYVNIKESQIVNAVAKQVGAVVVVTALATTLVLIRGAEEVKAESVATTMRPLTDGFSFPNYSGKPTNDEIDATVMAALFATPVPPCAAVTTPACLMSLPDVPSKATKLLSVAELGPATSPNPLPTAVSV